MNRLPDSIANSWPGSGRWTPAGTGRYRAATVSPCWTHQVRPGGSNLSGKGATDAAPHDSACHRCRLAVMPASAQSAPRGPSGVKARAERRAAAAKPQRRARGRLRASGPRPSRPSTKAPMTASTPRCSAMRRSRCAAAGRPCRRSICSARHERRRTVAALRAAPRHHRRPAGRSRRRRRLRHDADRGREALPGRATACPRPARSARRRSRRSTCRSASGIRQLCGLARPAQRHGLHLRPALRGGEHSGRGRRGGRGRQGRRGATSRWSARSTGRRRRSPRRSPR